MTELYVGVRDGYTAAQVKSETWKVRGEYRVPSYVDGGEKPAGRTGEDLFTDFAHLVKPRTN